MQSYTTTKKGTSDKLVHKALKRMARISGRTNFDVEMEDLARECGISLPNFTQHFQTKENFLQLAVDRMTELFVQEVTVKIKAYPMSDKNRVFYFLRCVEEYLQAYPEAGYLFTMTFFSNIVVSDLYHSLERYYSLWGKVLCDCLSSVTSPMLAKRLTDIYFISLKGQLQLADGEMVLRNSYHAENFLKEALFCINV